MDRKISFAALDWEERFGLHAEADTAVGNVFSLALGGALSVLFYGILILFRLRWGGTTLIEMFFHGGAAGRSIVPYFTVFLAMWCLAILLVKRRKLKLQQLGCMALPEAGLTCEAQLALLAERFEDPRAFMGPRMLEKRLKWELQKMNRSEIATLMEQEYAELEKYTDSTFTEIRGFIWAIPVLGFIGTVLGLAQAVQSFGALTGNNAAAFENALQQVTGGLATAFETTLIALTAALILQLWMIFQFRNEEKLLNQVRSATSGNAEE